MTAQKNPFVARDRGWLRTFLLLLIAGVVFLGVLVVGSGNVISSEPIQTASSAPAQTAGDGQIAAVGPVELGKEAFRRGDFARAAENFEAAIALSGDSADPAKRCDALLLLAQTDHLTGQYRKALEVLEQASSIAHGLNDNRLMASIENLTGNAHLGLGQLEEAEKHLQAARRLADASGAKDVRASVLNNLANLYATQRKNAEAAAAYRESAQMAEDVGDAMLAATASINGATFAQRKGSRAEAGQLLAIAAKRLQGTEDSYAKAWNLINAGICFESLRLHSPEDDGLVRQAYAAFNEALLVAQKISDQRTVSYAYGYLGQLYEEQGQLTEGLELTRKAIFAAQLQNATESLYRWHWQDGRLLEKLGKIDEAIASYRYAIGDLRKIRDEMESCYAAPDVSYQKTAKVICAELVDLLLQKAASVKKEEDLRPWLVEARDTLEVLKVFELREYFKDDCIDASRHVARKLDTISSRTAVFYPIMLPDRVELLVSLPGQLKRITIPVGVDAFTREVRDFRRTLVKRTTWEFLPHAQKLYDWLIRPLEHDLETMKLETLVFVPDGPLRTVPMAALHDGHQFLISRYRIAVTPSLNLTDPKPIRQEGARLLSLGVTKAVQGFPGLPYVADELKGIRQYFPGPALVDGDFRLANMEYELKKEPFSMVHIASHGQFGHNLSDTFLLAYDERFPMDRFGEYVGLFRFRDEPLDMLVLSACETAAGDDRAALGLAGVAVRAGARSALATLWHVNDPVTYELIVEFYRQLRIPSTSRAAALQAAQIKLAGDMRYEHPCYWAPFLLINNWL